LCEDAHPRLQALPKPPHPHLFRWCRHRHGGDRTARSRRTLPPTDGSSRRGRQRTWRCRARPGLVVLDAGRPAGRPDARVSRSSSPSGKSGGRRPPLGRLALGRPLPASAMLREEGRRSGFAGGDIERREE
jgi:hypothetical protein